MSAADIEDCFYRAKPTITQRAVALWELLLDFKADCDALPPDELSRRCVEMVAFIDAEQAKRRIGVGDDSYLPEPEAKAGGQ